MQGLNQTKLLCHAYVIDRNTDVFGIRLYESRVPDVYRYSQSISHATQAQHFHTTYMARYLQADHCSFCDGTSDIQNLSPSHSRNCRFSVSIVIVASNQPSYFISRISNVMHTFNHDLATAQYSQGSSRVECVLEGADGSGFLATSPPRYLFYQSRSHSPLIIERTM